MKIWLPDSLYRLKPLLLMLFGAILLYLSRNIYLSLLAVTCIGFAGWIFFMRLKWSNTGVVVSRFGSDPTGPPKSLVVDTSDF